MHLAPLIRDLAIILGVAGLMSLIFQKIRQPVVLGYIIAGVIVGPYTPPFQLITDLPSIQTWAELGVIFLMFSLGLEFSFRKLARVGASAAITAGTEVLFFLPVGFAVGKAFGWNSMDSIFLGAMLSVSSTTIIIKALDELKLKTHRFAELIFAVLIVEDLIAILLLVALSTIAVSQTVSGLALLTAAAKLVLVVGGWFIAGYFVVPRLMRYVAKVGNNELITIVSLGLCLTLVVFATHFHYSTALGAFIMGSILAETPILHRIEERMESLRDLFGAVFFVSIGMLLDPRIIWEYRGTVAVLCLITIVGKILSTSFGALISGQTLRNSVQVGFGLAQIGEFSFIIAGLGMTLKVTSEFLYPVAVAVSLVTTFTTPYLIKVSGPFAVFLEKKLPSRILDLLNRYAVSSEDRRTGAHRKKETLAPTLRWLMNGLTVSVLFVLISEAAVPYLRTTGVIQTPWLPILGWILAAGLSSPFIWAMLSAFKKKTSTGPSLLFSRVLTLIWVAALSGEFFPGRYVAFIITVILLASFGLFYGRLESYYRWFEQRFLSTFENTEEAAAPTSKLSHLAPWDAHLVKIEVHPNAKLVMKRLRDAELRTRYGINVVAIQRGLDTIIAPKPDEAILPKDELILLGTDEQVGLFREEAEAPSDLKEAPLPSSTYVLQHVKLSETSPLVGQSIRQSGVRERFQAMVVGVERDGRRNINPDSDLKLLPGDTLWVVGERGKLDQLIPLFLT